MTEKIESMEIHPMRGHSRGEWYCSLDDIAPSEEDAEYWAIFGVTHRGNKHCLGEFLTRAAADTAVHGLRSVWAPPEPSLSRRGRKVIQIEVVAEKNDSAMVDIFALCVNGDFPPPLSSSQTSLKRPCRQTWRAICKNWHCSCHVRGKVQKPAHRSQPASIFP